MSKPISPRQLQALQIAIQGIGISERQERLEWLSGQTGRTIGSTKELTFDEANRLLSHLDDGRDRKVKDMLWEEARRLVGKIYKKSFQISFLNRDYSGNDSPEDFEMNKAKINAWVRKYSGTGKNITQMDVEELRKVLGVMGKIARKEKEEAES